MGAAAERSGASFVEVALGSRRGITSGSTGAIVLPEPSFFGFASARFACRAASSECPTDFSNGTHGHAVPKLKAPRIVSAIIRSFVAKGIR